MNNDFFHYYNIIARKIIYCLISFKNNKIYVNTQCP